MNYFFLPKKKKIKTTSFNTIPYESIIGTAFNCIIYNRRQNQNSMETIWGGGAKLPLCRRIHTFIVTDTIESRNCIHCMWFGEYIDVGSKYSSPG